jgi:transcriptional regulator with XRE-family HTH domain
MTTSAFRYKYRHALGETIYRIRTEKSLILRDLAASSKVSIGHLSEVERGMKEASSEILESIARGLDVPLYEIIVEAGFRLGERQGAFDKVPEDFITKR